MIDVRRIVMKRYINDRLARRLIAAVLLSGITLAANAEVMMKAMPAPVAAQPVAALPAAQPAVIAPAAMQPIAQPTAGHTLAAPPPAPPMMIAPLPQMKLAPPSQGGGSAQINSSVACVSNNTPRINNMNGTQFGINFAPGSKLDITGCGFGKGGQIFLSGGVTPVQFQIDSWSDSHITAHIDSALGGLRDFSSAKVNIKPNGLATISSIETNKFTAARELTQLPLPPELGNYSTFYGPVDKRLTVNNKGTRVARMNYGGSCGDISIDNSPAKVMKDSWTVNFLADGFEVQDVTYTNQTDQTTSYTTGSQTGSQSLVGSAGGATWDPSSKTVAVVFQGNRAVMTAAGALVVGDATNSCSSLYFVSLNVSGPRGLSPVKN
jgi:hypothetical protein